MLVLPGHVEQPGQPLQEHGLHPAGHLVGVRQPVVVVEDEDGGDAAGADHEHDAAEVHPWNTRTTQLQIYFISIGFRCWDCYGNCGGAVVLTYEGGGVGDGQHVPHYRGEDGDGKHDRHS